MTDPYFFTVQGETPSKKNSRLTLRNGKNIPSKRYREWHKGATASLLEQKESLGITGPLDGTLAIALAFYHADNRRRDSDNGTSSILDTLQDAGVITDDRWQVVRTLHVRNFKSETARCEIGILQTEEDG